MNLNLTPNETLYITNILKKLSREEVKKALYAVFGQFGKILNIVVSKTNRLKGQAWVIFADISASTHALTSMQNFSFFDQELTVKYSSNKSRAIDGQYEFTGQQNNPRNIAKRPCRSESQNSKSYSDLTRLKSQPNKMLFVENIPRITTVDMLAMLFQQFKGFLEVRMVTARPGIAFVEFDSEERAAFAKNGLDKFRITPDNVMKVSYAKQ
eukprot:gnl/MRDRNA2_/MRDRNA2_85821_c0_seq1.p2 gnl/MRDRNA2_/MRDRNA2_85821_c0~~gnl/MRDRNA2_/MRDRNA2_85821_c0_seq1.p2  ORF type:complete len:211 (+),score=16.59 gnl/MRDRNA2_/MRDRNA2_85821_c0_seq1:35-667(+)